MKSISRGKDFYTWEASCSESSMIKLCWASASSYHNDEFLQNNRAKYRKYYHSINSIQNYYVFAVRIE